MEEEQPGSTVLLSLVEAGAVVVDGDKANSLVGEVRFPANPVDLQCFMNTTNEA